MRLYKPGRIYDGGLIILLIVGALAAGAGLFAGKLGGVGVTSAQIYAAENFYALSYDAATLYAKTCNAGAIPPSCHATIDLIDVNLDKAEAAYQVIRGLEQNPPKGAAATFTAAIAVVQAAIPAEYVRAVK